MGHVFVSYSRTEFYYAESVTAVINQSDGVRAWLDAENLRPGMDWAAGIDTALDTADALLLMASPAALASDYVRAEWTRALALGIPVHVAVVHTVSLPEELAHCPTHDLRTRFWSRARALAAKLADGEHVPSTALRRGPAVPLAVLSLMVLLCLGIVGTAAATLLDWDLHTRYTASAAQAGADRSSIYDTRYARFFLVLALCNAVVAGGFATVALRLLERRATPSSLRQCFLALLVIMLFDLETLPLARNRAFGDYFAAGVVVSVLGVVLVSWSRTVHLWMPTGEGQHHIRHRVLGRVVLRPKALKRSFAYQWTSYQPRFAALRESLAGVGAATSYDIVRHPADRPIANLIESACGAAGFDRDTVDAHWSFVIVSAHTDWKMLSSAHALFGDHTVFVLATSLLPPVGVDADTELVRRHQWLDFRGQDPASLYEFLRSVLPARRGRPVPTTVPLAMERFRGPTYLTSFLRVVQLVALLVAVAPLGLLIAGSSASGRGLALAVISLLLVGMLLRLAGRTAVRTLTPRQWRTRAWLILATCLVWVLVIPTTGSVPPAVRVLVVVLLPVWMAGFHRAFRLHWLPAAAPDRRCNESSAVVPRLVSFTLVLLGAALTAGYVFIAPLPTSP
ncbi:toll/interleukin-1 receptor domain-containing protein [Streptoalloteichus hindustanus]|uniref:TIR domain-containing protein n=1 Tax=Streptoalloteichus hindustanus TaxID=2017 RepID=A0A1M5MXK0_STRHI|nr:toll/interleukin-1 receptor domain-containing protein [Streptoalloteichus hindustanus]SHG82070.1 TIR domain-containing protein [Streptoalloteichus hindustanus]